jgi:hypothetical protein
MTTTWTSPPKGDTAMNDTPEDGDDLTPNLRTELVHVTPDMARNWLDAHNVGNRSISKGIVARYAREMQAGKWMLTHQGPAFDYTDFLIDGQHRLAAVVQSGKTVPMWITFGADPETFTVLDVGYRRQAAHLIPGPSAVVKAAACRYLTDPPRLAYTARLSNTDVVDLYEEHAAALDPAVTLGLKVYRGTRITSSQMTALLTVALESHVSDSRINAWVDALANGAGLPMGDPRLTLRNRFATDGKMLNKHGYESASLYLIVKAWNTFIEGRTVNRFILPNAGVVTAADVPTPKFK